MRAVTCLTGQGGMDSRLLSIGHRWYGLLRSKQENSTCLAFLPASCVRFWATNDFLQSCALVLAGQSHLPGEVLQCNEGNMGFGARETWIQM